MRQFRYDLLIGHEGFLSARDQASPKDRVLKMSLGAAGQLRLQLENSIVEQQSPVVYQESGEGKRRIAASYRLLGEGEVGIELGPYNRSQRLVIDPVITFTWNFICTYSMR